MTKIYLCSALIALSMVSCSKDDPTTPRMSQDVAVQSPSIDMDMARREFSMALSRAISSEPELAKFLRDEAQKEFDNNTDVLYHMVKDIKLSSGKAVRDLILSQWKNGADEFATFEAQSPLLNIFASDLSVFDKSLALEKWNLKEEVAVATVGSDGAHTLYVAGDSVASIEKDEVPAVPTFVVGENRRVEVASSLRSSVGGSSSFTYSFVHPAYDKAQNAPEFRNEYVEEAPVGDDWVSASHLDRELVEAWERTENGQLMDQRSLIYYKDGALRREFNEYLLRFKIDPKAYYQITGGKEEDDPRIQITNTVTTYGKRDATLDELMRVIWTRGNFAFSFEVFTPQIGGSIMRQQLVINVTPQELFVMNPERDYRHPTFFRKTRYTYRINPDKLEGRWVYPSRISQRPLVRVDGSWNLEVQGLHKQIRVTEMDKGAIHERAESFTSEFIVGSKISAGFKISDINLSAEASSSYKMVKTISTKSSYTDKDDELGTLVLHFYDPIIERYDRRRILLLPPRNRVRLKNISNGTVTATFIPAKY